MNIEYLGYIALAISLFSVTFTNMTRFRVVHIIACLTYGVYGYYIQANPILIGALLFGLIHSFYLGKKYWKSR